MISGCDCGMRLSFMFKFYLIRVTFDDRIVLRRPYFAENYVIIQKGWQPKRIFCLTPNYDRQRVYSGHEFLMCFNIC